MTRLPSGNAAPAASRKIPSIYHNGHKVFSPMVKSDGTPSKKWQIVAVFLDPAAAAEYKEELVASGRRARVVKPK